MSVVIRLMRAGAKKRPFYRMVAADSRRQRDGRFLEILGHYNPLTKPYEIVVHKARVEAWIGKGAQPSEQAASLLRGLGISLHRQPAPKVNGATAATAEAPKPKAKLAAKPGVKKAAPRKLSERKVAKKAERKAAKAAKAAKKA